MSRLPPEHLQAVLDLPAGPVSAKWITAAGKKFGLDSAAFAAAQPELRKRAAAKFDLASQMLFVREALEQSTSLEVARWHACHFPEGVPLFDLTCGIGGDAIALAERGRLTAFDLDPIRLGCAEYNLEIYGLSAAFQVQNALLAGQGVPDGAGVWADPGRRGEKGRLGNLEDYQPSPREILRAWSGASIIGFKLSPMDSDDDLRSLGIRREFISHRRECKEICVFDGPGLAQSELGEPGDWAVQVDTGTLLKLDGLPLPSSVESPLDLVFECDPAIIRGHGEAAFGMARLGDRPGFLTSASPQESVWLREFPVLWLGNLDVKRLKRQLREMGLRASAVKSRAANFDLPGFPKQLGPMEGEDAVVLVYEVHRSLRCVISRPAEAVQKA